MKYKKRNSEEYRRLAKRCREAACSVSEEKEQAELLARAKRDGTKPFLLALDGITDPHNLGALLRSAEAAGATGVVLPRHRAAHVTPTVAKAAAELQSQMCSNATTFAQTCEPWVTRRA